MASDSRVQLCVFDMRRGTVEGQELDKILFFSPANCPLPAQLSLIGLSEGLITFTKIFSPETPCELMEAERHTHFFYQCEPDLWMVLVVEKSKENEEAPRADALRALLREAHDLFVLFYGSIRALLHAHPAGDAARSCLYAFFPDYIADFGAGKKLRLPSVADSLTERRFVQFFLPQRETLLEALSLQGLLKSWFGGKTVRHVLILFQNILLSSTLPPGETASLFQYAILRLLPSALAQSSSKRGSSLRDRLPGAAVSNSSISSDSPLGPSRLRKMLSNLSTGSLTGETASPPTASSDGASVRGEGSKSHVPRPLAHEAWWRGADGFLDTDAWNTREEGSNDLPDVWLQSSEERMQLCVYQYKSLTILMLVPTSSGSEVVTTLKGQLLEKASQKIHKLEESLIKEWPGINAWHVAGYRYLYCDWDNRVSRFSPAGKVATLAKESLSTLNRIRAEIDLETGRKERSTSSRDRDFELCVRNKQNAWVIIRSRGGHDLYMVLERAGSTLLLACEAAEKLNKRYFNGLFSSD
ncbi:unnamed protein product [Calypogeia fissa]